MVDKITTWLLLFLLSAVNGQNDVGRLPRHAIPVSYELDIIIVGFVEFDGFFSILLEVDASTQGNGRITLNSIGLDIDEGRLSIVDAETGEEYQVTGTDDDRSVDFFYIDYDAPEEDHTIVLSGRYSGVLGTFFGLYVDAYTDLQSGETRLLAATDFEPNGARMAFPCLDEPDLKATFKLRIGRIDDGVYSSVANTPAVSVGEEPVDGYPGYVWDEYEATPVMSTYLVCFAVTDFAYEEASGSSSPMQRTWARRDAVEAGYASYSVNDVMPDLISFFEGQYGSVFPLPKLDQISYPTKGGAMENWGLVTYDEDLLLFDERQTGAQEKEDVVFVIGHENVHNWFGDLVTCEWWDSLWLNEGFAEFLVFFGVDAVEPGMRIWDSYYRIEMDATMQSDGRTSSHPIIQDVSDASDADFSYITYFKGSSVNRFLASLVTLDTYLDTMPGYLDDHAYAAVDFPDLWAPLNDAAHREGTLADDLDVGEIMNTYMVQMNYPLLSVSYDSATGVASLSQSRFLTDPENADPGDDYRWFVPLTYTFVGDGREDFEGTGHPEEFMRPEQMQMDLEIGESDLPVIFNIQNFGYLRVDYDQTNWNKLLSQLLTDFRAIHPTNRAALISDSYALAEAGIQPWRLPLVISQYLVGEDENTPMSVAVERLFDLVRSTPDDTNAMILRDFLSSLVTSAYGTIGIEEDTGNEHQENLFQVTIVSAVNFLQDDGFDSDCADVFSGWMSSSDPDDPEENPVNRHVRAYVYCGAVREIGSDAVEFLQERRANSALPQERGSIAYALSCQQASKDVDVASTLLDPILAHPWTPLDMAPGRLMRAVAANRPREAMGWLENNFNELQGKSQKMADSLIVELMDHMGKHGSSEEDLENINRFASLDSVGKRAKQSVREAAARTEASIRRRDLYAEDISRWIKEIL